MEGLCALDLYYLVKEMHSLDNARLDKVYQNENTFIFVFYATGQGKKFLHIQLPSYIFLAEEKDMVPEESGFCGILRKYCTGKKLQGFTQYGFERILVMDFGASKIIVELFDKGNIILTKQDGSIMAAHLQKKFRFRTIRGGIPYVFPENRQNVHGMPFEQFKVLMNNDEIVKLLARQASLGGKYAEEVCMLAHIEKHKQLLTHEELQHIYEIVQSLFDKPIQPSMYETTFAPFAITSQKPTKPFETFNQLIAFLSQQEKPVFINPQIAKIQNILDKQKSSLEELDKEQQTYTLIGNKIYEHYAQLSKLLDYASEQRKKNPEALKKLLQEKNILFDERTAKITLELQ
jgi:predicted ribosome quality control (RQC) complex YloA/Tae2 family protein